MSEADWKPNDRAFLTPATLLAPRAAYRHEQVTVLRVFGELVEIRYDDGRVVEVDRANLRRTRPVSRETKPRRRKAAPALELAPDEVEETLW
jgi:hypothetical protein